MIAVFGAIRCRWHRMGRRLFFLHCSLVVVGLLLALPARTGAQELPSARILQRQARVMRNESGMYRVVEAMLVELDREVPLDFVLPEPLGLVVVNAVTGSVMGIGGDVPVTQIVFDEPQIAIIDWRTTAGSGNASRIPSYLPRDLGHCDRGHQAMVVDALIDRGIERNDFNFLPETRPWLRTGGNPALIGDHNQLMRSSRQVRLVKRNSGPSRSNDGHPRKSVMCIGR